MKSQICIDLHQDLLLHLRRRDLFRSKEYQTSFQQLQNSGVRLVLASGFALPDNDDVFDHFVLGLLEKDFSEYCQYCRQHLQWVIVRSSQDLHELFKSDDRFGLILHIEGLNVVDDSSWGLFEQWYQMGWRSVGPVWNKTNPFGGGAGDFAETGLTLFGKQFLRWAQDHQMIVDCAHMNRKSFWDAAEILQGPIVVTHGNADALCPDPRNYSDDQLRHIANTGGVIGVFLSSKYLTKNHEATIDDIVQHIDYIRATIGDDHIALGSDFGGITSGTPQGLSSVSELSNLWDTLRSCGYSQETIEKIAYRNAQRVLKELLPSL